MSSQTLQLTSEYDDDVDNMSDSDSDWRHSAEDSCDDDDDVDDVGHSSVQFEITDCNPGATERKYVAFESCLYCVFFVCHHAGFLFVGYVAVFFLLSNNAVVDMQTWTLG